MLSLTASVIMFDAGATVVPSFTASIRLAVAEIAVYTIIAVASEHRWGRRGLLYSWLLAAFGEPLWMLVRLRWSSFYTSSPAAQHATWTFFASILVTQLLTFGASALAIRRVGRTGAHPQAIWVRVCAGIFAGCVGGVVGLVLVIVATLVGYGG